MAAHGVFATVPADMPEQIATVTVTVEVSPKLLNAILRRVHLSSIETDLIRRIAYHHEEPREAARALGISPARAVRMYEKVRDMLTDAAEDERGDILDCFVDDTRRAAPKKRAHCQRGKEQCKGTRVCQCSGVDWEPVLRTYAVGGGW